LCKTILKAIIIVELNTECGLSGRDGRIVGGAEARAGECLGWQPSFWRNQRVGSSGVESPH